jgi:hypothetical protein
MSSRGDEMQESPGTWSPDMLKAFRELCLYRPVVPFALISKETLIESSSKTLTERSTYIGFIPYEGLDLVPFEMHTEDDMDAHPTHIGYVQIVDGPPYASIYACVKRRAPFVSVFNEMITQSGIFRGKMGLHFEIDGLQGVREDQLPGRQLPIKSVSIHPQAISCGGKWFEERASRLPVKKSKGVSLRTKASYAWLVLTNIFKILLVIYLFRLASTPFETALLAGLVLIFADIRLSKATGLEMFIKGQEQFKYLLRLLHDPALYQDETREAFNEDEKTTGELRIKQTIDAISLSVLSLIALWKIASTIF